jgi:hypothetical protein
MMEASHTLFLFYGRSRRAREQTKERERDYRYHEVFHLFSLLASLSLSPFLS